MPLPLPPGLPGLPVLGNLLEFFRDPVGLVRRGHQLRGPIFSLRLGPKRAVVLLGPENHRFFFESTDRFLRMREIYLFLLPMIGDFMVFEGGNRALLAPSFHGRSLHLHVAAMVDETRGWLDGLGEEGEIELVETFGALLLHIAAHCFMGLDFRRRMGTEAWRLFHDLAGGIEFILPPNLPTPRFRRRDRARRRLEAMVQALIAERRGLAAPPEDLLQSLLEARGADGQALADETIRSAVLAIIFAGHETTQGQLSWTLIQLLQHPDYLASIEDERQTVLGPAPALDLGTLKQLKRLRWAMRETERMQPVATFITRYTAEPYDWGGYHVPNGWLTMICPAVSQRLPDVFDHPDLYDPERFSPAAGAVREAPASIVTFGGGKHMCLGREFAYLEMGVILTLLLERYRLELVDPDPRPATGLVTGKPQPPCLVRYRRR
jgi:sterol 14-demethylase